MGGSDIDPIVHPSHPLILGLSQFGGKQIIYPHYILPIPHIGPSVFLQRGAIVQITQNLPFVTLA